MPDNATSLGSFWADFWYTGPTCLSCWVCACSLIDAWRPTSCVVSLSLRHPTFYGTLFSTWCSSGRFLISANFAKIDTFQADSYSRFIIGRNVRRRKIVFRKIVIFRKFSKFISGEIGLLDDIMWSVTTWYPANTRRWANVGLMLAQRLRRWANIKPTLFQRLCGVIVHTEHQ